MTPKAQATGWTSSKLKTFVLQRHYKKVKNNLQNGKKTFANHISDMGLISRIQKEFFQLNNKKTNNLNGQRM